MDFLRIIIPFALLVFFTCAVTAEGLGVFRPDRPGTSDNLRLQDFCIFKHDGFTYTAPMMKDFAYKGIFIARSKDLQDWQILGNAIPTRTSEDTDMVWAPHVVEVDGVYHMFYTGVTQPEPARWCQRILIASTKDPSKPDSWERNYDAEFIVDGKTQSWFRPDHEGSVWSDKTWADCRDPMVLKHDGTWYMFYSGADTTGGVMGVATAPDVLGPWKDQGTVLRLTTGGIPESCFVLVAPDDTFVLVTNHAHPEKEKGGIKTARAKSLVPIDGEPSFTDLRLISDTTGEPIKGWAHEFIQEDDYHITCAALGNYDIHFLPAYFRGEEFGWTIASNPTPNTCEYVKSLADGTPAYLREKLVSEVNTASRTLSICDEDEKTTSLVVQVDTTDINSGDKVNVAGIISTVGKSRAIIASKIRKVAARD